MGLFSVVYLGAWFANGLYGTSFDLQSLIGLLKTIGDFITMIIAKFGIDSVFNTDIPWLKQLLNKFGGNLSEEGNVSRSTPISFSGKE